MCVIPSVSRPHRKAISMNKCVFSVDFYSSGAERFPPVPPGLLISYPIYILHSLIKTFPPFLCFFPFFFLFLPTSLFILLPPFTLLPSTLQPWSIHLLHSPYLFCVSHPFSPSYRFPCSFSTCMGLLFRATEPRACNTLTRVI